MNLCNVLTSVLLYTIQIQQIYYILYIYWHCNTYLHLTLFGIYRISSKMAARMHAAARSSRLSFYLLSCLFMFVMFVCGLEAIIQYGSAKLLEIGKTFGLYPPPKLDFIFFSMYIFAWVFLRMFIFIFEYIFAIFSQAKTSGKNKNCYVYGSVCIMKIKILWFWFWP